MAPIRLCRGSPGRERRESSHGCTNHRAHLREFGDCADPDPEARALGCLRRFSFLRAMSPRARCESFPLRIIPPRQAPRALSARAPAGPKNNRAGASGSPETGRRCTRETTHTDLSAANRETMRQSPRGKGTNLRTRCWAGAHWPQTPRKLLCTGVGPHSTTHFLRPDIASGPFHSAIHSPSIHCPFRP